jgi:uncharacterized membrane protein HdeD (DUF308 family)
LTGIILITTIVRLSVLRENREIDMKFKDLWWILLLRGIILILFGLIAIAWPAITFVALTLVFALYILLSGVINIIQGVMGINHHRYWFLTLAIGVLELGIGAYALNSPNVTVAVFVLLIGLTFIIRGVLEIIAAFDDMHIGSNRLLLIVIGILGILAGIIIMRYPVTGTLAFTWVIGVYALIAGAISIALSISTKDLPLDVPVKETRRMRA